MYPQHEHISRLSLLVCLSVFACTPVHRNSPTTSTDSLACYVGALTKQLSDSFVSQNMCSSPCLILTPSTRVFHGSMLGSRRMLSLVRPFDSVIWCTDAQSTPKRRLCKTESLSCTTTNCNRSSSFVWHGHSKKYKDALQHLVHKLHLKQQSGLVVLRNNRLHRSQSHQGDTNQVNDEPRMHVH